MLEVLAPAKINLSLEVLAKRPDGFHEVRSVIQAINLCDRLSFGAGRDIEFQSTMAEWLPEKSLVSRAVGLLKQTGQCQEGARIEIEHHIPLVSGLGGDSSDAAAVLSGLNRLWGLGLPEEALVELAWQLGSDVAFFLHRGTALAQGRGERITPLPPLPRQWVVLMVPPLPRLQRKTERLYASLKPSHYTDGQITDRLVTGLAGAEVVPAVLFNVFDSVARGCFPGLDGYWQQFAEAGAADVHLAGSGPALFTLMKDKPRAEKIYQQLRQQGLESYLVDTVLPAGRAHRKFKRVD
jgi:4-diphosphocytidyl-2-C-methyl-D-erythritol kinase